MRYLGIDYGTKKIGVAISDDGGGFAFPRDVIANDGKVYDTLANIIETEKIEGLVVGDTLTLNGGANDITPKATAFVEKLVERTNIAVHRVREAWSSQEAARFAPQGKKHSDSSAAAVILQRFLDAQAKSE